MIRLIFIISILCVTVLVAYPQKNIIIGTDDGNLEADYKIESSNFINDDSNIDYRPDKAYDGDIKTAWCVGNSGVGEWIKFYFRPGPPEIYNVLKGKRNLYRLGIINGLVASKKLYYQNNRIKKMSAEFDGDQKRIIEFKDGIFDYQDFIFNIRSRWVKLTILEIYKGSKYNDTCICSTDFRTIYDLTRDEIKKSRQRVDR
jgi:hypothetical protein